MTVSFAQMFGDTLPQSAEISPTCGAAVCELSATLHVGERLPRAFDEELDLSLLSDDELQKRIDLCSLQFLAAHKLGFKAERRRWYDEEAKALRERARRPAMVAAMEAERGLR